jgi:hypothetical protein
MIACRWFFPARKGKDEEVVVGSLERDIVLSPPHSGLPPRWGEGN